MKKRIILFILCLCIAVPLWGCSGAFDALNFNRKPLPNPSSPVDPSLEPTNQRVENSMTKNEFADLIERTFKDRDSFSETLTTSFAERYNVYGCKTSVNVLDKTVVGDDKPYASYKRITNENGHREEVNETIFFNDYFLDSSYYYIAYEMDSYLDDLDFIPYETVKNGIFPVFFQLFADNANNIYSDYHNGSQRTYVALDDNVIDFLDSYAREAFSFLYTEPGEVTSISSLEMSIDNNTISQARLDLSYKRQRISFDFKLEQVEEEINHSQSGYNNLVPSYVYALRNTALKFTNEDESFYTSMPYQATISYTVNDTYSYIGLANEFSYYRTSFNYEDYTFYLKAVSSLDETIFNPAYYPYNYVYDVYLKQGENISYVDPNSEDRGDYTLWIEITALRIQYLLSLSFADTYSITETENTYKIEAHYAYNSESYDYNKHATIEMSKDFSKIFSVEYSIFDDGQLTEDEKIVFSYDFTLDIPTEVLEFSNNVA